MKFIIEGSQGGYFREEGHLELEGILSDEQVSVLNTAVGSTPARDLWRKSDLVRRMLFSRELSKAVGALAEKSRLRLGCDQLITKGVAPGTLKDLVSIQGILCGVVIRLAGEGDIPSEPGCALFLAPETEFMLAPGERFIIAVFCDERSVYICNDNDPYTHDLKAFGYGFGDRLREKHHPMVLR